jgi:hypothetical protein
MNDFEKLVGKTFPAYRAIKEAELFFLHPPMRAAGFKGSAPCWVQVGKAPYDLGGFYYDRVGTAIGVELKETSQHENRLSIIGKDKKGSGLQHHQLLALVELHRAGGMAALVWNNGGEIGVLGGTGLVNAFLTYDAAAKSQNAPVGSKSILWGAFTPVPLGVGGLPAWLPTSPSSAKVKRSK